MPGSGGEEDEINIRMEVVVDPDGPNPMTTYVEAQVYILKVFFSGNAGTVHVQVAEDDMVAEAETKAKGEAEVKAGLQRGGNKVRRLYCLRLNSCNPIHATISPCPGQRRSAAGRD